MVFSSPVFLLFFLPLALVVYYNPFFRGRRFRNHTLLLFSLAFYAWGEPLFVFVMMLSILVNWLLAKVMDRQQDPLRRRLWMLVPILLDIGLIFFFKYLSFFGRHVGACWAGRSAWRSRCPSHLLLHLPDHVLRAGCLPAQGPHAA